MFLVLFQTLINIVFSVILCTFPVIVLLGCFLFYPHTLNILRALLGGLIVIVLGCCFSDLYLLVMIIVTGMVAITNHHTGIVVGILLLPIPFILLVASLWLLIKAYRNSHLNKQSSFKSFLHFYLFSLTLSMSVNFALTVSQIYQNTLKYQNAGIKKPIYKAKYKDYRKYKN